MCVSIEKSCLVCRGSYYTLFCIVIFSIVTLCSTCGPRGAHTKRDTRVIAFVCSGILRFASKIGRETSSLNANKRNVIP